MRSLSAILSPRPGKPAKKKQRGKTQRRRTVPRWRRPALYAAGMAALFGGLGGGAYWFWTSGTAARLADHARKTIIEATVDVGLAVDEVLVEGRSEATREQLLHAIGVRRNDPILTIDTDAVRERLIALGWIADAIVQRRLPGTLYVRIEERKAMAIWQRKGRFVLVDGTGSVIGTERLDRYAHLKVIVGETAPQHAPALLAMMATAPTLMQRVRAGVWVGGRRWNLRLDDGIDIRLPETGMHAAWDRLVRLERDRQLLSRDITAVDLRFRDRLVVQRRDPGSST